jgi:hypothetical protein
VTSEPARRHFRILTRTRGGYAGATLYDVQLQAVATGNLLWAQTFTEPNEAEAFAESLDHDLDDLEVGEFRRKHGIPGDA